MNPLGLPAVHFLAIYIIIIEQAQLQLQLREPDQPSDELQIAGVFPRAERRGTGHGALRLKY